MKSRKHNSYLARVIGVELISDFVSPQKETATITILDDYWRRGTIPVCPHVARNAMDKIVTITIEVE